MRIRRLRRVLSALIALLLTAEPRLAVAGDQCVQTAGMIVYSNAYFSKETGDLDGFELAFKRDTSSAGDVLLFVYEGGPSQGILLRGHIAGNKLFVDGNWEEHGMEYPSRKETVENHAVKIDGTFDSSHFRGRISISGLGDVDRAKLKRVRQVWMCRGR
jgi:hypothetical protein